VFEGVDAAGKTTQIAMLERALGDRGIPVTTTGVFKTRYGGDLRTWFMDADRMAVANPRTQLFLLGSAMSQLADEIEASSASTVLVDRFIYTTMAYHGGGLQIGIDAVQDVYAPIIRRLQPELVIILDLPCDLIARRKSAADRIEGKDAAFYERVRKAYLAIASTMTNAVVIDAQQSRREVHHQILQLVTGRLSSALTG
jgi:dTMP kinase